MEQRTQLHKRIKVCGYHGQSDQARAVIKSQSFSLAEAVQAYEQGQRAALAGMACDCSQCRSK